MPPERDMADPDDQKLVERLQQGDEAAFATLFGKHDAALRRTALGFVSTPASAEEVVQDTWVAVLDGLRSFEGRSSIKTWIFGILINRARTRGVREARTIFDPARMAHHNAGARTAGDRVMSKSRSRRTGHQGGRP